MQDDGVDLFYVVNFANDCGYVLISANKNYAPVLAFNDSGNFNIDKIKESGLAIWTDEVSENIKQANNADLEVRKQNRATWSAFLKKYKLFDRKSKSRMIYEDDEEEGKINQQIYEWYMDGYSVYTVADYKENYSYLPSLPLVAETKMNEIYEMPFDTEKMAYPKDYNYVLVMDKYKTIISVPNLMSTSWHQEEPYNNAVEYSYSNGEHVLLGCTAIALGQVLKYYAEVPGYNFDNMPNSTTTNCPDLAIFLYMVGKKIGIRYDFLKSEASINQVEYALNEFGYTYSLRNHSMGDVANSLQAGCPVIMFGTDSNGSSGKDASHAWVCDGVSQTEHTGGFKIMCLDYHSDDTIYQPYLEAINTVNTASYLYYHMNWGFKDIANGSYYYDNVSVGSYNFTQGRQDLLYIKK